MLAAGGDLIATRLKKCDARLLKVILEKTFYKFNVLKGKYAKIV